jgi:hypothetical protein
MMPSTDFTKFDHDAYDKIDLPSKFEGMEFPVTTA